MNLKNGEHNTNFELFILPTEGICSIKELSRYLDLPANTVQQKLIEFGIDILSFSRLHKHKLIRLEDLRQKSRKKANDLDEFKKWRT